MNLIVVTDRRQAADAGRSLVEVVAAVVAGGARTVLLREKDLPRPDRAVLAKDLVALGASLLVASDAELARDVGAAGVHLAAAEPAPVFVAITTKTGAGSLVVGRSCHSVEELRAARAEGMDYATLSPIWATDSKPGYGPALGIEGLGAVPELATYALGGVGPGRVAACMAAGAAGVAVMGEIMRADDPTAVVRQLLEEMA